MSAGVLLLLVVTPFAFGSVEPWAVAIVEMAAFGLFALHAGTGGLELPRSRPARALLLLLFLLVALVLLQLLPLPDFLLRLISPASLELHRTFGASRPGGFATIGVARDATLQELVKLLAYAALFFVCVGRFRSRAQLKRLVWTILLTSVLLVVVAVAQKLTWNGMILWFYPAVRDVRSNFGIWGPYVNRNHFAGYLATALPLGFGLLLSYAPAGKSPVGISLRGRIVWTLGNADFYRAAAIVLLLLPVALCLLATLSRSGITAAAAATLFFVGIASRTRTLRGSAVRFGLTAALVGAVVLIPALPVLVRRFAAIGKGTGLARLDIWRDSLAILRDFPLFGAGLGSYGSIFRHYQEHYTKSLFDHAHNDYLEMATDTGALGFLLAVGIAAVFFVALLRGWKRKHGYFGKAIGAGGLASCVAMAVLSAVDFNLRVPANALLFTVVAALTASAIFTHRTPDGRPVVATVPGQGAPRKGPGLFALCAAAAAVLMITIPARAFFADRHYRAGTRLLNAGTADKPVATPLTLQTLPVHLAATADLEKAAALTPTRPAYRQALAEQYLRLGIWASAREGGGAPLPDGVLSGSGALARAVWEMDAAVRFEPANPERHFALGRTLDAAGDAARAGVEFGKAASALPRSAPMRYAVAAALLGVGDRVRAREHAAALVRIDPASLSRALAIAAGAGADDASLQAMVPSTTEGRKAYEIFRKSRGMERE